MPVRCRKSVPTAWLRLVLTHELAHTVHLEQAHGLWRAGRAVLGRAPYSGWKIFGAIGGAVLLVALIILVLSLAG